ncbi:MmgE/PrpD family protein [[Eubacterium] cellulosolvens]
MGRDAAMSVTMALAKHIESIESRNIPAKVADHAKLCLLDWLGCAIAGSLEPAGKIAKELVMSMGRTNESTIIGTTARTCSPNAALVNGIFGHCIELDDIHAESIIHPAAPVMPAALAICEREKLSGAELLTSIVSGYEAEIRIATAITPSHYRYWHTTGTCGTFGATAAVGKLLSLGVEELVHAFGIAGTQASGLVEAFGTMSKPLNAGKAAMNGVIAGLLAGRGFTGSDRILEADKGYCRATSDSFDPDAIVGKPEVWEITRNIFKRHSCCGHMHGALDAVIAILEETRIQVEDIKRVNVRTYPIAVDLLGRAARPRSESEARFSLPYCVALALLHRRVGPAEFAVHEGSDDAVFELSKKVNIEVDREISTRLGAASVEVELTNGETIRRRVAHPKGHPANPLSRTELEEKFRTLASVVVDEEETKALIGMIRDLEKLSRLEDLLELVRVDEAAANA